MSTCARPIRTCVPEVEADIYNHRLMVTVLVSGSLAQGVKSMLRTILIIILVLAVLGSLPAWPYSTGWGYYPSGGLGLLLIILIVLAVMDNRARV